MKHCVNDLYNFALSSNWKIPQPQVRQIFKNLCIVVKELHAIGIAHLDLRLENVLFDKKGKMKLGDFRCSFICKSNQSRFVGQSFDIPKVCVDELNQRSTKNYTAPEVFDSVPSVFNPFLADIYSIGVILHVLLTGLFPNRCNLEYARDTLPESCYLLLSSILRDAPTERLSLDQILSHHWVKSKSS